MRKNASAFRFASLGKFVYHLLCLHASDLILREHTDNWHLHVFLLKMLLVATAQDGEAEEGE